MASCVSFDSVVSSSCNAPAPVHIGCHRRLPWCTSAADRADMDRRSFVDRRAWDTEGWAVPPSRVHFWDTPLIPKAEWQRSIGMRQRPMQRYSSNRTRCECFLSRSVQCNPRKRKRKEKKEKNVNCETMKSEISIRRCTHDSCRTEACELDCMSSTYTWPELEVFLANDFFLLEEFDGVPETHGARCQQARCEHENCSCSDRASWTSPAAWIEVRGNLL